MTMVMSSTIPMSFMAFTISVHTRFSILTRSRFIGVSRHLLNCHSFMEEVGWCFLKRAQISTFYHHVPLFSDFDIFKGPQRHIAEYGSASSYCLRRNGW